MFAQGRVTVTEIRGIARRMIFMIVCKKLNEEISRNIIVAYLDTCGRLKDYGKRLKCRKL